MTKVFTFFDHVDGDGEQHIATLDCFGYRKLVFGVDYTYPPEEDDFVNEYEEDPSPAWFEISAIGVINGMPGADIPIRTRDGDIIRGIEAERGIFEIDVTGIDQIGLVLNTEPPTNYTTTITVKGNLI